MQENIEIADKADLSYGGVFQNRMNKPILYIKKIFENEDFGNIISAGVKLQWCRFQEYYNDEWHGRWKTDGGVINQQAIHHIDALFHLFGRQNVYLGFLVTSIISWKPKILLLLQGCLSKEASLQ